MAATVSAHRKGDQFSAWKKMIGGYRFYFGEAWGINNESKAGKAIASRAATLLEREYSAAKIRDGGWTDANKTEALNRVKAALSVPKPNAKPLVDLNTWLDVMATTAVRPAAMPPAEMLLLKRRLGGLEHAVAEYKQAQDERFATKKISGKRLRAIHQTLSAAITAFPNKRVPLKDIGRDEVQAAVNHWLKRPVSSKTGQPLGALTAVHRVMALGHFFKWAYNAEHWDAFRNWEAIFSVKPSSLMSEAEKHQVEQGEKNDAKGTADERRYTVEELSLLFAHAPARTRLYLLMGLNCGMGQTEIATLRTWHLQLTAQPPMIERKRNKTKVQAQWELWKETAAAMRLGVNSSGPAKAIEQEGSAIDFRRTAAVGADWSTLALRTSEGFPLVHDSTDTIRLAWERLYKKTDVKALVKSGQLRRLSFYALRRTGAQAVRRIGGYETSKIYLAHSSLEKSGSQSVSEKHYTERTPEDFGRVAEALRTFRQQLQPMFDAAKKADAAKAAAKDQKSAA